MSKKDRSASKDGKPSKGKERSAGRRTEHATEHQAKKSVAAFTDRPDLPPHADNPGSSAGVAQDSKAIDAVRGLSRPVFAQPEPTPDPTIFRLRHPSDKDAYKEIDTLNAEHKLFPLPFPLPRGGTEPRLTLEEVLGGNKNAIRNIQRTGQLVFHSTGDCGSTKGPATQNAVTDKMTADFSETASSEVPQFALLLGDIVYNFGEAKYYYDQFYEPYRDYPAPILACAGNHDGMVSPESHASSLSAYLRNFCCDTFTVMPEAGGLSRTAQIQPGVFFTFEAPFLRVLVLYSNTLEDPGVIADERIGDSQLQFLDAALQRVKDESYQGALLIATHHPSYTVSAHGWSVAMTEQIDALCAKHNVWPHAFLSGHAHNYQRFTRTRTVNGAQVPYIVCGNGGHGLAKLAKHGDPILRAPQVIQQASKTADQVVLESYDDQHYGYLRLVATSTQLRIEYHPSEEGVVTKSPADHLTINLHDRRVAHFVASNLGQVESASAVRALFENSQT